MKLSKLMIVSIILLAILSIGAVSATNNESVVLQEGGSSNSLNTNNFNKKVYVNVTGNDSGSGQESSPYATINKAISEVNASENAVIYLGSGTFIGENNVGLQINLAHKNYNGSLTFIGSPKGDTIIDGGDESSIFKSISADSFVTFVNITFAHGKSDMGSAIRSSGTLIIDGCVFTENDATNLAAIYQEANNLTIINSKFLNNTGKQCVDIYFSQNSLITLINNIFDSSTATYSYSYAPSCSIQTGKSIIKGNTFKNLKGSYYSGALYVAYNNGDNVANITDNNFVNCTFTGTNGAVVFFQNAYLKNNKFVNCSSTTTLLHSNTDFNSFVTFNDCKIDGTRFTLTANVTDDVGNPVKNAKVVFYLDGKNVASAYSDNNGLASATINKLLENGEYVISGTQAYSTTNVFDVTVVNGTATVDFDHSPAEVWISPNGDDTNGDGSKDNPFLTLKHALDNGTASSVDLTVHVMDGLYNGSLNRGLSYSNVGRITIIGESYGNVVIDAQNGGNLFTFGQYLEVTLINLTLTNCNSYVVNAYTIAMKDCIVTNSKNVRVQSGNDGAIFDHVIFDKMNGQINVYNGDFYNCEFKNSNAGTSTGFLWLTTNNGLTAYLVNNTFFNNTIAGYSGGAAYYIQCSLISINNTFDSNKVTGTSASYIAYASGNTITSVNDKFINNNVTKYVVQYRSSGDNPEIIVENITVINNFASGNGAGLSTTGARIKGGKFINNTALGNGGAINFLSNSKTADVCDISVEDVIFENNKAAMGNDIFIEAPTSTSYAFANLNNLTITANNLNVTELSDILTVSVTHPSGAIIGGGEVTFYFDGNIIGKSQLVNGNAILEYVGFKNNTVYQFSAVYAYASQNDTYVNGTVSTNIAEALDSIDLYVSDINGSDETGDGTIDNPFKSISKALSTGYKKSTNITVHVLEGNYSGTLNTNLQIPCTVDVTIAGEGQDKTIITDSTADYFITALPGTSKLTLSNMTVKRAARDAQSAIYVEEGANVAIDNVAFTNGQGNYGGAINNLGNLFVNNSYFFDNGYFDITKRANAYWGGAIYNDGVLIIDNTTFEGNHAGRLSTIANQGTLYMSNSYVIDSVNAYAMNMDLIAIGAYGGQKGHMTFVNTTFKVTNRTIDDVIDGHVYDKARSVICLGIGSCEDVTIYDSTFVNEGTRFSPYVFGGINSWNLAGGGYTLVPGDVYVYNSTFSNVEAVNVFYSRIDGASYHSQRVFDGCLFDNVNYLVATLNTGNFSISIQNSVILSDSISKIGIASGKTINMDISNNWWGSNNATYDAATIGTTNFISNYVLKLKENSGSVVNPESYLIATLNATNHTGLIQEVTLAFKVFDGENVTDYDGALNPSREFTITATNGTLEITNGTLDNNIVSSFEGTENQGYYVEASIDGVIVNLTGDKLVIGNATILAENIEMYYGYTEVNVTVLDGTEPATVGKIILKVSGNEYVAEINNGTATFSIDVLPYGEYDLDYIINDTKVYNIATNSSKLNILPYVVTNDTYEMFFDENGKLKDTFKGYELIFEGAFSNLGVDAINITKSVDLIGNNAVLEDIGLIIGADDVTVDNFAINLSNESNAAVAIVVYGDDVCVENSVITVNSSEVDDSIGILVDGAEDFVLTNNIINYTGNSDGSAVNNAIRLEDADGAVIEDNIINISIPSVPVTYLPPDWDATVLSEGIVVDTSDDVVLSNNTINVDYNKVTGYYDSVYAVEFVDSDNAIITDNEITTNGNSYAYGLTLNGENFTVEGNNITTTGNNYANGIQINGPASGNITGNNIDAEAPSVVYPVYSYGRNVVTYTDNNISGTSNSVYAMELFGTNETVKDNNIVANGNFTIGVASKSKNLVLENNTIIANGTNKGTPTSGDSIKSETTGVKAVAGSTAITNNTIISTGDSAVKTEASGYITNNTLVANDTTGDAAVDYTPNQALIVDDNVPKMEKVFITADDVVMYYKNGTRYVITLSDGSGNLLANKPVTITINGVSYSRATNAQGTASVALNLVAGNYTVSASFAGDENYGKASIENTVTILSTVSADNLVKVYRNASQYYATFVDGQGNPLAKTDVTFNINGVMYTRKTNENGTAKLNINLDQGTFVITATNPVNGETHSNNITVLPTIANNKDLVKYYKNASQYVVTLIGDDGNPVGAGETVTFNINGVFYTRTTNATGQAKLNINLDPGVFVITAEYKGCKVSNTVTVKPVLSASDLTKKYGTPDQFIATLLDGQGNPVDGEIVTFNINGVFYNRITRDGGQAKLNINLQPGEFIITSSYNGTSISNTVKVEA